MTVMDLKTALNAEILTETADMGREITDGYCGDLLSWVMGRAKENSVWITIMGNVNAIAVAVLADVSCILLADSSPLDTEALKRANLQGVAILRSELDQFSLSAKIYSMLHTTV
ncbi:MAG: DRTGG domain-containing protein [Oscillospiraceae bacterium]